MTREAQIVSGLTSISLLEELGRLITNRKITIQEATQIYTRSRRERMIAQARQEVERAVDALIVYHVRGVGQRRSEESEVEERSQREWLTDALDGLVRASQRAVLTTWKLEPGRVSSSCPKIEQASEQRTDPAPADVMGEG